MGKQLEHPVDFQDYLSPVFVKELRQGLRADRFVWPFIVVQVVALACISLEYLVRHVIDGNSTGSGALSPVLFYPLLWLTFTLVLPLTLFGSLQTELSPGRNIELLILSTLSRWQIVIGKWLVGTALSLLMLTSLLPYWLIRYLLGGIGSLATEGMIISSIICSNAAMNAVVIGASGFRNYVGRVFLILLLSLFSYLTILAVVAGSGGDWNRGRFTTLSILWTITVTLLGCILVIVLNLQLGRAKLKLFENPLDPPGSASILVLIVCSPIMIGIVAGISDGRASWIMALILLVFALTIDRGPGKMKSEPTAKPD